MIVQLKILRLDGGTQPRAELDGAIVDAYAEAMRAGDTFPRPTVFHDEAPRSLCRSFPRSAERRYAKSAVLEGTPPEKARARREKRIKAYFAQHGAAA